MPLLAGIVGFVILVLVRSSAYGGDDALWLRWGIPPIVRYPQETTGVASRVIKLGEIPGGLLVLTADAAIVSNGTRWERLSTLRQASDYVVGPDGRVFVAGLDGVHELRPSSDGLFEAVPVLSAALLPEGARLVRRIAFARNTIFALEGTRMMVAPVGGDPRVVQFPQWANAVFTIGDEIFLIGATGSILSRWDWGAGEARGAESLLDGARHEWVVKVVPRRAGGVWFISEAGGVFGFDGQRSWVWAGESELKTHGITVTDVADLGGDALAIATADQGLFFFTEAGDVRKRIQQSDGLGGAGVEALGADAQGGLWADARPGLLRISRDLDFLCFDDRHGIAGRVNSVLVQGGRVYAGTGVGLFQSDPEAKQMGHLFRRISDARPVRSIVADDDGLLTLGAQWKAVDQAGRDYVIASVDGSALIRPSQFRQIAYASNYEGVHWARRESGVWVHRGLLTGIDRQAYSMGEAPDGSVWVGLGHGTVARIQPSDTGGEARMFGPADGVSEGWCQVAIIDGNVYVSGQPCVRWDNSAGRFVPAPDMTYYVGGPPFGLEQVFGRSRGEAVVARNGNSGNVVLRPVDYVLGQISVYADTSDFRATCIDYEDTAAAWIGSRLGLMRAAQPRRERPAAATMPTLIRIVDLATGQDIPFTAREGATLALTAQQRSLRVEAMLGDFTAPHLNRHQFFLVGFDSDWPGWSTSNFREFTNLPWGKYRLALQAMNPGGQTTGTLTIEVHIAAPFYASSLAIAAYVVFLVLLILGIVRWRMAHLRRLNLELKAAVDERTREVAQQAGELEQKNEELQASLQHSQMLAQQARAAMEAKSRFLANMSHEIRTPMNGVIGMCSLLADTPLGADQQDYVRTIRHSGESLLTIINDVLDLSKAEAGRMAFETIAFDVAEVLEETLDLLAHQAHTKGLELCVRIAPGVETRRIGDPTRLRQVLVNLAGNAIKFTPRGEVVLELDTVPASPDRLLFRVRDTGIGIPAEKRSLLFQPFSQVDAATTRQFGGTGLGLAISREIIDRMGGRIECDSVAGQGTVFSFEAELRVAETAGQGQGAAEASVLKGKRLLVVDDNASCREMLTDLGRAWGMTVESAADAERCHALLGQGAAFDVALLDGEVSRRPGLELAAEMRRRGFTSLRLVILTTLGNPNRNTPGAAAVDAFLAKPVHRKLLLDCLNHAFTGKPLPTSPSGDGRLAAIPVLECARSLRVLVAEDNVVNQRLAALMLRRFGVTADVVANGLEAVEAVERQPYDLVLMDVHMPEMDGIEASNRIHERMLAGRRPRIIAVTAGVSSEELAACRNAAMDGFIAKPFNPADIARELTITAGARSGVAGASDTRD